MDTLENKGASISPENAARQQDILKSGESWSAYEFARDITGADIPALQQVVLDQGGCWNAYYFAKDIQGADIAALQQVVLDSRDGEVAYVFSKYIPDADLQLLSNRLVELHSTGEDFGYLNAFNKDTDIQSRLKTQQATAGKKRKPS